MIFGLLDHLRARGVTIEAVGDRLRYRGPREALSREVIETLRAHKADILRLLSLPPAEPIQTVRDLRAAWAGACFELAEALGWPETPFKPAHAVAPGPIPWRRFTGVASIPDLQRVLAALRAHAGTIPLPPKRDGNVRPSGGSADAD